VTDTRQIRFVQQLGRSYRALVAGFEARTGHTLARWRILILLETRGAMSQKELAKELGIDPAALTRQLKGLERDGWVRREADTQDARLTNVMLTAAGHETVERTMPHRNDYIEWVLGDVSPEQLDALADVLVRLETRLSRRT
jgi:DNA-binding MarR family transcriptional regulator